MRSLAVAVLAAATLVACGGDDGAPLLQPRYQPEIRNDVDSFSFQLTGVADGDGSLSYTWQNTGAAATVDRSSALSSGSVTLTLRDAHGAVVWEGALEGASGSVATAAGAAGAWTIGVDFVGATGTINFRAQKSTP